MGRSCLYFLVWVSFGSFLACESLHVCTVCIWRCEHARFCVEVFYALYINFHSFIHSSWVLRVGSVRYAAIFLCNSGRVKPLYCGLLESFRPGTCNHVGWLSYLRPSCRVCLRVGQTVKRRPPWVIQIGWFNYLRPSLVLEAGSNCCTAAFLGDSGRVIPLPATILGDSDRVIQLSATLLGVWVRLGQSVILRPSWVIYVRWIRYPRPSWVIQVGWFSYLRPCVLEGGSNHYSATFLGDSGRVNPLYDDLLTLCRLGEFFFPSYGNLHGCSGQVSPTTRSLLPQKVARQNAGF